MDWAIVFSLVSEKTGLSQIHLAELTGFSQPHVSRLIKGTARCFDIRAINRMIDGLGAPRSFAGLAPAPGAGGVTVALNPPEEVSPIHRRALLATSLALPIAAILGPDVQPRVVTQGYARTIRSLLPELYKLDDQRGGAPVSDVTQWCLREVDGLLATVEYDEAAGRDLQLAYGELAPALADFTTVGSGRAVAHLDECLAATRSSTNAAARDLLDRAAALDLVRAA